MHLRCLILSLVIGLSSCNKQPRTPGICLSLDDRSVKGWYALRSTFKEYGAHVTFFVTQFDSLSPSEIQMLRQLQSDGHEIASHGALHVQAEQYIKEHSYSEYVTNEIDPGISSMQKAGFQPVSFAYPYGSKYWFTDYLLLKKFKTTRGVAFLKKGQSIADLDDIFYGFDGNRKLSSLEIDGQSPLSQTMITQAMERAQGKEEVLLLSGHQPSDSSEAGAYSFDREVLRFILDQAKSRRLRFYRVKDLATQR